jgi:hypothetical protein
MLVPLWLCLISGMAGIFVGYLVHNFLQAILASASFAVVVIAVALGVARLKSNGIDLVSMTGTLLEQFNLL